MSKNDMVMVPRELLERCRQFTLDIKSPVCLRLDLDTALNKPAEQHQGEPVAWVIDTPEGRDADYYPGKGLDTLEPGTKLYTHADPGEVERWKASAEHFTGVSIKASEEVSRLRKAVKRQQGVINQFECEVADLRAQLVERDALISEVLEAFQLEPDGSCINPGRDFIRPWAEKVAALSASAEPSAPVEIDERVAFESLCKDAERYRWMRNHKEISFVAVESQSGSEPIWVSGFEMDSKIDTAMFAEARTALERKP